MLVKYGAFVTIGECIVCLWPLAHFLLIWMTEMSELIFLQVYQINEEFSWYGSRADRQRALRADG